VIGVLIDALAAARETLEIELNGVDDNPLVDPDVGEIHHGGNFYGGHVCFAMDSLKVAVAGIADLLDRQLVLLCDPATSDGLPENLVAGEEPERRVHHGFKAMQITASALAAEALKLTMPAAAFSRSTESHNQDKVSMGTIAARDCLRVLELSERVAAIVLLAAAQAVDLRGPDTSCPASVAVRDRVRDAVPMLTADRRQDLDVARVVALHRAAALPTPAPPHLHTRDG
jgi:histidine ammonia-lyase